MPPPLHHEREEAVLDPATAEAVRAHLALMRITEAAETTVYSRYRALRRLTASLGKPLLEATETDLLAWRATLAGLSPHTVAQYVCHVHAFYSWALDWDRVDTDPARRLPAPRTDPGLPRPINGDDLDEALRTAPERVRPWLVLAGWAGLRAKEIALLRRENVLETADPPMLLVAAGATKGRRGRPVEMAPFVLAELRRAGLPPRGHVFTRRDGRRGPNTPGVVSKLSNRHLATWDATLHQLRHWFATELYAESRCDLLLVQRRLGHRSPETTAGYAQVVDGAAWEAISRIRTPRTLAAVVGP